MFTDTHCHLTDDYCANDQLDAVIARAHAAGVTRLICATSDANDILPAIKIAETHDNIFVTAGIHPEYAGINPQEFITPDVLAHPRVVGIGEIGLDYHGDDVPARDAQIKLFTEQLEMARRGGLPVAIHTRDAEEDTATILADFPEIGGVMHCFTSGWGLAKKMLDRGFYFSASGILTFKNAGDIRDTFAKIPANRIVVETDSPYCAPVPYRGRVCEPAFVVETARVVAGIKNIPFEKFCDIVVENTKHLYPKIKI